MNLDEAIGQLEELVAEIRRVSLTDDRTSLGSALALRDEARMFSEGKSLFDVVVFGDLDDFKQLNDEHTHDAGDVAIRSVGDAIHQLVVTELKSRAFRKSGDEFVILLEARSIERFLSAVSSFGEIPFSYYEKQLRTAMSLGYARGDGKASFDALLERAEVACQIAKAKGSGACIEWTDSIKQNPLVRVNGRCKSCGARISCTVPKQNAPLQLTSCPCCDAPISDS